LRDSRTYLVEDFPWFGAKRL